MSTPISENDVLQCKFCKIDLDNGGSRSVGFITCPDCQKCFLKLPARAIPSKDFNLSLSRKKMVGFFPTETTSSDELVKLNGCLEDAKQKNEALVSNQSQELIEKNVELEKLKDEMENVHSELEKLSSKNEELRMQVSENIFEYDRICRVLGEKNLLLSQAKKDYEEAKETLDQKVSLFSALEKEDDFKNRTLLSSRQEISSLTTSVEEYKSNLIEMQKLVVVKQSEIAELQLSLKIVPEFEVEIDNAMAKVQTIQGELDKGFLETASIDQLEILNDEISILKEECLEKETLINELRNSKQSLSASEKEEGVNSKPVSIISSNELSSNKAKEEQLEYANDKVESLTIEFEITKDELENAKKEINGLNTMLEKAFYENQKQVDSDKKLASPIVHEAREIEIREENLNSQTAELKESIANYKKLLGGRKSLKNALIVKRINTKGESKEAVIFDKGLGLPTKGLQIRKSVKYSVIRNKGEFEYFHDDGRGTNIEKFSVNFGSNLNFFLNPEDFSNLEDHDVEVAIHEEYVLGSDGQLSVYFYRNNGFKFFERRIGVLLIEKDLGLSNIL